MIHLLPDSLRAEIARPTAHFAWSEVEASVTATARGINNTLPQALEINALYTAWQMERVRLVVGTPLVVSSWYRSPRLNGAVGSGSTSAHLLAMAVDFVPDGIDIDRAYERLTRSVLPFDQLIIETSRSGARWIHAGWMRHPRRTVMVAVWDAVLKKMTFRQRTAEG